MVGCDWGGTNDQVANVPPVHLVDLLVTTSLDADGTPIRTPVASDGTTRDVLGTSSIVLRFDRFLDPISPTRQAICLQPALDAVTSYRDCAGTDLLQPSYDPVWREVVFWQAKGARLAPQTTYRLSVFSPPDNESPGFRAFDGAPLDATTTFELTTIAEDPPLAKDELPPKGDRFCADAPCLAACEVAPSVRACSDDCRTAALACGAACSTDPCRHDCDATAAACAPACIATCRSKCPQGVSASLRACASGGCHSRSVDADAAAGLELGSADAVVATALEHVAHETQTGEHAARGETRPVRFGRAMPIVAPGVPGQSYLLYKQFVGADYAATEAAPAREELDRLRDTIVVGMPMPPTASAWAGLAGLTRQARWISLGAETRACP